MEYRSTPSVPTLRVEQRNSNSPAVIVGYAAVFYNPKVPGTEYVMGDRFKIRERILRGAFTRAIREMDVIAVFNHNVNLILGRSSAGTLKLSEDGTGLRYEIAAPPTSMGRDLMELLRRGDVRGSSFQFLATGEKYTTHQNGEQIRLIHEAKLYDVGPVVMPAYTATTAGVRTAEPAPDWQMDLMRRRLRLAEAQC